MGNGPIARRLVVRLEAVRAEHCGPVESFQPYKREKPVPRFYDLAWDVKVQVPAYRPLLVLRRASTERRLSLLCPDGAHIPISIWDWSKVGPLRPGLPEAMHE